MSHRARAEWDNDGCIRLTGRDLGIDVVAVEGTIAGDGRHRTLDLAEQGADLRAVIGILIGRYRGEDGAGVAASECDAGGRSWL